MMLIVRLAAFAMLSMLGISKITRLPYLPNC
jgi:hypothetical protein